MAERRLTAAQQAAAAQAQQLQQQLREHRRLVQALSTQRPGMCMADGWVVSSDTLDGEFDLDGPLIERLLSAGAIAPGPGAQWRAAPAPLPSRAPGPTGPSALESYLFPPEPQAAAGSAARMGEELPSALYGPGNVLANVGSATAGTLQGLGERRGAVLMQQGLRDILERRAQRVALAPGVELYNAAQARQAPRPRLRVRGVPMTWVRSAIPGHGTGWNDWRLSGSGSHASLRARGMSPSQLRGTQVLVGQQRLPSVVRWASTPAGGGILTFGPSAVLDAYASIETDLGTGRRTFNTNNFLIAQARSQSGNAIGFGVSLAVGVVAVTVGGAAAAVGAPVLLIGLGLGFAAQLVWNGMGGADWAESQARAALR